MNTKIEQTAPEAAYNGLIPNSPLRFISYVSRPHSLFAFGSIVAVILAQLFSSLNPVILKNIVDGLTDGTGSAEQLQLLAFWGFVYILFLLLSFLFWRLSAFTGLEWLSRMNKTSYETLYEYVSFHSNKYFSDQFAGALSNKVSNASDGGERMLERSLWGWFPEVLTLIIGFFLLFSVDLYIAIAFTLVMVTMTVINFFLVRRRRPHVVAYAAASSKLRGEGVDFLTNITAVRQYARRTHEISRISDSTDDRRRKDVFQWRMSEWTIALNNAVTVLLVAGIFLYLYILFRDNAVTVGDVVLTIVVLGRITHLITFLGSMMNGFIRLYGEIQEGLSAILVPHGVVDSTPRKKLKVGNGSIDWKDVCFEYGESAVFKNFNLTIRPGERIGLVGPSGAGKTTFVSLLLRQHDIDAGEITIDEQNIAQVTQDSLRNSIAVVPQEPALFHRSIRENIVYGNLKAKAEDIERVAKMAEAHGFIKDLPQGYDTLVGERGVKLSGGQRQRVAIARAMLKDAPILLLDEATSALDSVSEVAIQKALHTLMKGKTVVAIAHRLSTLREMDRIVVLENGAITESGTHEELTRSGGTYARLWEHQAGGFLQD